MFNHILVPVDGSKPSLLAARKAAELAKVFGSSVTAVYVVDPYPFTGVGADFAYGQSQYLSAATAEADTALNLVKAIMQEEGQSVTTLVSEAHGVHEGIVSTMVSVGADLIVMGSQGRRGLEKLMLGSVTQRVLGAVKIPVLVVRE
ncbi:universal stress protein [Comamonas sp. Y33R10-2]|uniref:universal stress protein n=1 Tax=Comamonas sp. Y33R10-2 TaxID=2853257 RepID=UPI001C5C9856|nr:universal stress protein [Comamonas sp. Y33R10-2]QXZ11339.1 universal stress protein [Comamonas sp. Y33R10-2]